MLSGSTAGVSAVAQNDNQTYAQDHTHYRLATTILLPDEYWLTVPYQGSVDKGPWFFLGERQMNIFRTALVTLALTMTASTQNAPIKIQYISAFSNAVPFPRIALKQ